MKQKSQSPALKEANSLFKQIVEKTATDYEKTQQAFHTNRERLKAERLAREAEQRRQSHRTP
ncbi:hypothetical protein [Bradyrhizobium cosmicum]|uniref:hypothetical protein n=1 Tax=Bradyrhizobium cosmicum TaxID=1404864 RepID=UPI0028E1FA3C|nr:hypothetical protein [Bradyrhizobium cosmicum]